MLQRHLQQTMKRRNTCTFRVAATVPVLRRKTRKRRTRLTGVGCVDERRKDEGRGNDDAEPSCSFAVHGGCPTTSIDSSVCVILRFSKVLLTSLKQPYWGAFILWGEWSAAMLH